MEYREMKPHEAPAVAGLYTALAAYIRDTTQDDYFDFDPHAEMDISRELEAAVHDTGNAVYIALDEGEIIGLAAGEIRRCFLPVSKVRDIGYISAAYVLPAYRGRGIMKRLEEMLVVFFQDRGIQYMELNVMKQNTLGREAWRKLGYTAFREQMRKKI